MWFLFTGSTGQIYIYVINIYICIYAYKHVCIHVHMYLCKYVNMYICIYVYMYICIYVYMYICIYVYMYICIYVYMYICIYVYMYICICIYIYIVSDPTMVAISAVMSSHNSPEGCRAKWIPFLHHKLRPRSNDVPRPTSMNRRPRHANGSIQAHPAPPWLTTAKRTAWKMAGTGL